MIQLTRGDYFPTSIWQAELGEAEEWKPELIKSVDALRKNDPDGVNISNKKGWQSAKNLHNMTDFALLNNRFTDAMLSIARFLKLQDNIRPVISQCWANVNPRGGYNVAHCHANSFLSGVYYVAVPENSGNIIFYDPRVQMDAMRGPVKEVSAYTAPEVIYKPKEGLLILFPSWLLHRVEPNDSDRERISIAFNSWMS